VHYLLTYYRWHERYQFSYAFKLKHESAFLRRQECLGHLRVTTMLFGYKTIAHGTLTSAGGNVVTQKKMLESCGHGLHAVYQIIRRDMPEDTIRVIAAARTLNPKCKWDPNI
jgi:hypothetical protein